MADFNSSTLANKFSMNAKLSETVFMCNTELVNCGV